MFFYSCNSGCTKINVDNEELVWLAPFKTTKLLEYHSDNGDTLKFDVIEKPVFYTECLRLSHGPNVYQFLGYEMVLNNDSINENANFTIKLNEYHLTKDYDYSYKRMNVFGYHVLFSDYTNDYLNLDTVKIGKYSNILTYFFNSNDSLNIRAPKGSYTKNFHWSKKYGLVRFETWEGEVFELVID